MAKLYVGNLSFNTNADDLRAAVEVYAPVTSIEIVADRMTGRSRGFGFVEIMDNSEAVVAALNGVELDGQRISVRIDQSPVTNSGLQSQPRFESNPDDSSMNSSSVCFVEPAIDDQAEEARFANDWAYAYRQYSSGAFQEMQGQYVGVFREHVVAVGESEEELRQTFSASTSGAPDQLVVLWIDQNDIR